MLNLSEYIMELVEYEDGHFEIRYKGPSTEWEWQWHLNLTEELLWDRKVPKKYSTYKSAEEAAESLKRILRKEDESLKVKKTHRV